MKNELNFTLLLVVSTAWFGVQIQSMYNLTKIDYFTVDKKKIHIDIFGYRLLFENLLDFCSTIQSYGVIF